MKRYIKKIQKKLLKLKKSSSISRSSRSDDPSFSSVLSSESSESQTGFSQTVKNPSGLATPTSVLSNSNDSEWIDNFITSAFQMMDHNGDGKIGMQDLQILLSRFGGKGLSEEEVKLMLRDVDKDGNGCIGLEDLRFIGEAIESPPTCVDDLRETFELFDTDHDGKISAEELYTVFKTIVGDEGCTLDECERMIKGVDSNGDGFVCFQDFSLMMESQLKR